MVTLDDIKNYKEIGTKIDNLAKEYYEEFIYCNDTYEYLGWELDDDEITIIYSYLNYNDERCNGYVRLTLDELNGDILSSTIHTKDENVFYRGQTHIENNNGIINIF